MPILKNEPIYPFKETDYSHPRHIIVEGSYEEIGFDLATLAKTEFGTKLHVYDDPVYGIARRQYLALHWPQMLEKSQGVLRAFGLPADDVVYDATALEFDFYDWVRGATLGANTCSAAVLPIEKSANNATFISHNLDFFPSVLWSDVRGLQPPEGAYKGYERTFVLETRPDNGFKTIMVGGHDLLCPQLDALNEKGLYISIFHDPTVRGMEMSPFSGMNVSGITITQVLSLLLDTCATVEEAKLKILQNRIMQVGMCLHLIIADATGNATIFEMDESTQAYLFTDRKANEPLFITNHQVSKYPDPSTYPEFEEDAEHNTFKRMHIFNDAYAKLKPPFKKVDATAMSDAVHCAFVDWKKADSVPNERTITNTTTDLSKPEISVRFYLGDVGPIPDTNHMETRMSDYYTFGF